MIKKQTFDSPGFLIHLPSGGQMIQLIKQITNGRNALWIKFIDESRIYRYTDSSYMSALSSDARETYQFQDAHRMET